MTPVDYSSLSRGQALSRVESELDVISPGLGDPVMIALDSEPVEVVVCAARLLEGTVASPVLVGGMDAFLTMCRRLSPYRDDPVCDWAWDWYLDRLYLMPVELVCDALIASAVD